MLSPPKIQLRRSSASGFTLIELLTVIAIVGILAAIIIPVIGNVKKSAGQASGISAIRNIGNAMMLYSTDNENYFPGPLAGGLSPAYQNSQGTLGYYLWEYLGSPEPGSETFHLDTVRDLYRESLGYYTFWIRSGSGGNVLMSNGERKDPFGYPSGDPTDPRYNTYRVFDVADPANTVAFEDADQTNTWSGAGWHKDLPEEPIYPSRLRMYFDFHVEAVDLSDS